MLAETKRLKLTEGSMTFTRRSFLKTVAAGACFANYRLLAAPFEKLVKITAIKTLGLDNLGDGCLIKIETDAGIAGYGEAGISSKLARDRIDLMQKDLIGQDPLAIERHFYMMSATQYSFIAHIPTVSGVDIALWDLAGKIMGLPVYRLLGGPIRKEIPVYSHGGPRNMLDLGECRAWAQSVKQAPEGFTAFKFGFPEGLGGRQGGPFVNTLDGADFRKAAKSCTSLRTAPGQGLDIAMHC